MKTTRNDAEKALKKRVDDILKARKTKDEDIPTFRGGRSWNQIADDFCTRILKKLEKDGVSSVTIPVGVMREMVGDPDNVAFRSRCRTHGIKIAKDSYTNAYTIEKFDRIKKELKRLGKKEDIGV